MMNVDKQCPNLNPASLPLGKRILLCLAKRSKEARHEGLALGRVIPKLRVIPSVMRPGAWD